MAVATCFRLLATMLLLALAGRCYSQQMDHIQLSRIADSIDNLGRIADSADNLGRIADSVDNLGRIADSVDKLGRTADSVGNLTHVVQAQAVASERVASGLMKMFTLMAKDHLVCERGWYKLRSSCYFISEDTSNWEESRQKCITMNSDLVKITRDDEYNFLHDLVKGHHTYVGLSDLQEEGTYRWVADGTIHQIVESWWGEGEPTNSFRYGSISQGEDCVHYRSSNDGFNDIDCNKQFRYICEKPAQLGWNFASVPDEDTPTEK